MYNILNISIFDPTYLVQFFTTSIDTLKTLVIGLGAGLGVWGVVNLLEGYGNDSAALISA